MATETQVAPNDANASLKGKTNHAPVGSSTSAPVHCPDPSAHQPKNSTLQDQASAAALYSTGGRPAKTQSGKDGNILGPDGKLSSASAATSLKHARAQDLPGFPVVGIDTQSSAGTAATLANANKKSPEWWKPEQSAAAGKAALLAKDYKMAPLWQPEASTAGSKAALLAHKGGSDLNLWKPEASAAGHSAATLAFKRQGTGLVVDNAPANDRNHKALLAATGAVSSSGRKRAQSTPAPPPLYPDSSNSAKNALNAAKLAHTPSTRVAKPQPSSTETDSNRLGSGAMEAARIQHSKSISREMYTEHPPVALEVEEKQRQAALRASAISMAKQMYDVQQNHIDQAAGRPSHAHSGATAAHGQQHQHATDADIKEQAMRYIGIQEAAQKLAAERLAKIGPDENAAFRSYYGYEKPSRTKLSIRRNRNRAQTDPEDSESDEDDLRSRRIRSQMSQFNKTLAEVDAKKREQDRKSLLAAAERKVQAQMQGLDQKIFDQTGKMSPAMIDEWDAKARAKAAAASEARMENHGRVHIGNGKYMDQADIDAVAQARIQPTLDEITEKTEKRRAEEEERRLDLEEKKRVQQKEKQRAAELKAEEKRVKDEEKRALKARNAEEKAAAKQGKEAEKEKKAEEKRIMKEKEKERAVDAADTTAADPTDTVTGETAVASSESPRTANAAATREESDNEDLYRDLTPVPPRAEADTSIPTSPTSPRSEGKGIKSFLNKFKRRSKHSAASAEDEKPGFIGGASLRASSTPSNPTAGAESPAAEIAPTYSRRYSDVSSLYSTPDDTDTRGRSPKRTVSGHSAVSGGTDFEEARDGFNEELAPPPNFTSSDTAAGRKGSPNRDSRFHEVGI